MSIDLERLPAFFAAWVSHHGNRGAVGEVAQWLANGSFDPAEFAEIVAKHRCAREPWFRDAVLDLVIGYANERLAAGPPDIPDISDLLLLQKALHVNDEELFERRPSEISSLIQNQFDSILADGVIDNAEDLYLVELQAAFRLSYDQLMILARPAIERAFATLSTGIGTGRQWTPANRAAVRRKLAALEPMYRLAVARHRTLGGLY